MKRLLAMGALLALVAASGSASATSVYWAKHNQTGGATATTWDCATNWSTGLVPTAADTAILWNAWYPTGTAATRTVGQIVADNGAYFQFSNPWTLVVTDDCGNTGDFIWRSNHRIESVSGFTLDIEGNFLQTNTSLYFMNYASNSTIILRGTDKAFKYAGSDRTSYLKTLEIYGSYWDNGSRTPGSTASRAQRRSRRRCTCSRSWATRAAASPKATG